MYICQWGMCVHEQISNVTDYAYAPSVKDRATAMIRAILTDGGGNVISYQDLTVEIFADVVLETNEDVVWIEKLPVGTHEIAGETVVVKPCGMLSLHFVSRATGHKDVETFKKKDFSY